MRKKAWARPELAQCPYFIENPRALKGHWQEWFPKKQPLHLELGMGKGTFTAELAAQHPEINYIGIDISSDVLGVARRNIEARYQRDNLPVTNIALMSFDIERILEMLDEHDSIEKLYINFCNPWPKVRHHKKRLTHSRQLALYKTFMKHGAELHFKTDDDDLYLATLRYLEESGLEILWHTTDLHSCEDSPQCRITSEHEDRFTAQGIKIKAIVARFP
jgi:tRNA (guanine-N7-)-methyltransferase